MACVPLRCLLGLNSGTRHSTSKAGLPVGEVQCSPGESLLEICCGKERVVPCQQASENKYAILDQRAAQQEWLVIVAAVAIYVVAAGTMGLGVLCMVAMVMYSSWPKAISLTLAALPPQPWVLDVSACRGGIPSLVQPRRQPSKFGYAP